MTITLTLPTIVFIVSLAIGWTGFLLGAIKWLLNRQLIGLETRVEAGEKKAGELGTAIANIRLEFSQKATCNNHTRMEENDGRLFVRMDSLHGDMREMLGEMNRMNRSLDMLNQHHLNGGN